MNTDRFFDGPLTAKGIEVRTRCSTTTSSCPKSTGLTCEEHETPEIVVKDARMIFSSHQEAQPRFQVLLAGGEKGPGNEVARGPARHI